MNCTSMYREEEKYNTLCSALHGLDIEKFIFQWPEIQFTVRSTEMKQ